MRAHLRQELTLNHHIALAQAWIGRASAFFPERREAIQFPASSPPAVPPHFDPRINVAVLVAMPRRKDAQPALGSVHPSDRFGLFFDEGQLELGLTSLLCERAMCTTPEEYKRTT
jgi:hypothetical protein